MTNPEHSKIEENLRRPLAQLDASVTDYYDSLSEEEQAEERDWGKFSESEFFRLNP